MILYTYWDCDVAGGRPTMFAHGEACRKHGRDFGYESLVRAELQEDRDCLLLSAFSMALTAESHGGSFLGSRPFNPHEPLSDQVLKCVNDEKE